MTVLDVAVIREFLAKDGAKRIRQIIAEASVQDLAGAINQLPNREKVRFYLFLPSSMASDVLLELSAHSRKFILKSLKDKYIVSLIEKTESDDSADILGEVSQSTVRRIIGRLTKSKKEAIAQLIRYDEDTAGGIMKSEYIAVPTTMRVQDALSKVRKEQEQSAYVHYVYVIDKDHRLKGVVALEDLVTSKGTKKMSQVMNKKIVQLTPNLDEGEVADVFKQEDLYALPVVDSRKKLLGIITMDDVLDIVEEEATEDMLKIAGVNPDENIFDPVYSSLKRRFPWLVVNLATAILAALTIALFTETIEAVVILAALMPIVAGMGGNAGTQTLTLMVRGFALNQLNMTNYAKVLWKEVALGFINGTLIGIIMGVIGWLWTDNVWIGVIILASMVVTLIVAGLTGTSIPIILRKMKIDPAVSSSVFITTFTDVVGFFTFLGIATMLISLLI